MHAMIARRVLIYKLWVPQKEQSRLLGRLLNACAEASIPFRSLFTRVRVHIALVAPVVGLGAIRVGRMVGWDIGAVFGSVSADGMASPFGHGGHREEG